MNKVWVLSAGNNQNLWCCIGEPLFSDASSRASDTAISEDDSEVTY